MSRVHDFRHLPVARSAIRRVLGLIGREDARALFLFIPDCSGVHTWFMRASIDLVFLDGQGVVVSTREEARPWRTHSCPARAAAVMELPPGFARRAGIDVGDRVLVPATNRTRSTRKKKRYNAARRLRIHLPGDSFNDFPDQSPR